MRTDRYSRQHVRTPKWAGVLLLFLVFEFIGLAQEKPRNSVQISEKQKGAEAAVDRALTRFYEGLDFGVVYREMYTADAELRRVEVGLITDNIMGGWDAHRKIDFSTREKAYIAYSNFEWLITAMSLTRPDGPDPKDLDAAGEKYLALLTKAHKERILTEERLETEYISVMNQMADQLRKYVLRENFNSAGYRTKISQIQESQADQRQELRKLFWGVGSLKPETEIYVVRHGRYYFYLIEEHGSFKLLTYSDRIRF